MKIYQVTKLFDYSKLHHWVGCVNYYTIL